MNCKICNSKLEINKKYNTAGWCPFCRDWMDLKTSSTADEVLNFVRDGEASNEL
jgi:hypothetical protein